VLKGFDLERHRPALLFVEDHLLSWQTHSYTSAGAATGSSNARHLNNWYVPAGAPFK